jgi:hypothetical protein
MARGQPRIAVITPYHKEAEQYLSTCCRSVQLQKVPVDHFLVADGHPSRWFDDKDVKHVVLHRCHDDNGNTPRGIGGLLAIRDGYEFLAYLDVDNWYHERHLATLLALHERSGAPICCAWRTYHTADGTTMNVAERDEDNLSHVDTSCLLIHRSAFEIAMLWLKMPKQVSPIGDRILFAAIKHHKFETAFSLERTIAFRSQYGFHYRMAGIVPTTPLKPDSVLDASFAYLASNEGRADIHNRLGFDPLTHIEFPS